MRKKIQAAKQDIKEHKHGYMIGGVVVFVYGSVMINGLSNLRTAQLQYNTARVNASSNEE